MNEPKTSSPKFRSDGHFQVAAWEMNGIPG